MSDTLGAPVLGAPVEQQQEEYKPILAGYGEEKVVTVFNPLPSDFRVVFARTKTGAVQPSDGLKFAREKAGLPLEKANPQQHFTHDIILKAGKLTNLPGDIAQKAVQDLVSFIIQTRNDDGSYDFAGRGGNKGMVPDPFKRHQIEEEVIQGINDAMSFFNKTTPSEYTEKQITELNDPVKSQVEESNEPAPNPAPGTGVSYTPAPAVPASPGQPSAAQPGPAKAAKPAAKSK